MVGGIIFKVGWHTYKIFGVYFAVGGRDFERLEMSPSIISGTKNGLANASST